MEISSIEKLKSFDRNRSEDTGYGKNNIEMNYKRMKHLTVAGSYDNVKYDKYVIQAMKKLETDILQLAEKFEQLDYAITKAKAKIEAENILMEGNIMPLQQED